MTVVVLVPGMGDDVQAIKAGIMEIADIFVINKADRPGVDQLEREIEANRSTRLPHRRDRRHGHPRTARLSLETRPRKQHAQTLQWSIDHLGIAVRSLDEALPFYQNTSACRFWPRETVEHEKVNVAMLPAGASRIELLEAIDPTPPSRNSSKSAAPACTTSRCAYPISTPSFSASKPADPRPRQAPTRRRRTPLRLRPSCLNRWRTMGTYSGPGAHLTSRIGIIGGSGLYSMPGFEAEKEVSITTPFGAPSDNYVVGELEAATSPSSRATAAAIASRPPN